jgi:hypothetical protein
MYQYIGIEAFLIGWKSVTFANVSISLLLDPDPHSQNGYGSRGAKSMRVWIHNI